MSTILPDAGEAQEAVQGGDDGVQVTTRSHERGHAGQLLRDHERAKTMPYLASIICTKVEKPSSAARAAYHSFALSMNAKPTKKTPPRGKGTAPRSGQGRRTS